MWVWEVYVLTVYTLLLAEVSDVHLESVTNYNLRDGEHKTTSRTLILIFILLLLQLLDKGAQKTFKCVVNYKTGYTNHIGGKYKHIGKKRLDL